MAASRWPSKDASTSGELPARRGRLGPDAVLPAVEAHVLHHVAGLVNAGESGADAEIHVGQDAVLRVAAAHADRARIPAQNLEIDIAHPGVESSRAGIAASAAAGEEDHVLFVSRVLIARACSRRARRPAAFAPYPISRIAGDTYTVLPRR